jgi:hypothetical protein
VGITSTAVEKVVAEADTNRARPNDVVRWLEHILLVVERDRLQYKWNFGAAGITSYLFQDLSSDTIYVDAGLNTLLSFSWLLVPKHSNLSLSLSHDHRQGRQDIKSGQAKTKAARFCLQTDSALVAVFLIPLRSRLGRSLPMFPPIEAEILRRNTVHTGAAI